MSYVTHANADLTPKARAKLARLVLEDGWTLRRAAERFQCSPATAKKWTDRYLTCGEAGMADVSSRPRRSPNRTGVRTERRIVALRFTRRWGPHRIAAHLHLARSTGRSEVVQSARADPDRAAVAAGRGRRRERNQRAPCGCPGMSELSGGAPVGFPAWLGWQHFLNLFFMIFMIRSGATILADHPRLYWTRHSTPGRDWFRVQKPVPGNPFYTAKEDSITLPVGVGLPGRRHSMGLARWWHLGIDTLWLVNGIVFYVLLFATGQWMRLVPMRWDVIPNSISVMIQYLSLEWPVENGGTTTTACS